MYLEINKVKMQFLDHVYPIFPMTKFNDNRFI